MNINEEVELLRRIPFFAQIDISKLKLLAFMSESLSFQAGQVMFAQGEVGDAAYVILKGDAQVVVETPDGPIVVAELGRNDFVGEIAILCDVPRTAGIVAKSELQALKIKKEEFFHLVREFPEVGVAVMRDLAMRLHVTTQALSEARAKLKANGEE